MSRAELADEAQKLRNWRDRLPDVKSERDEARAEVKELHRDQRHRSHSVLAGVRGLRDRTHRDQPSEEPTMNAPKRFRKRPVEIEAMQWDGHPGTAMMVCVWINSRFGAATFSAGRILIRTLEGDMEASPGDYVIRDVQGAFYTCKPAIFAATYDEVTE